MKKVSIIVPVFNEPNLPDLMPRLLALKEKLPDSEFEFIFVGVELHLGCLVEHVVELQQHPSRHPPRHRDTTIHDDPNRLHDLG